MRLSELLAQHPELDMDLGDAEILDEGDVFTDVVALVRCLRPEDMSDSLLLASSPPTAPLIRLGMLHQGLYWQSNDMCQAD